MAYDMDDYVDVAARIAAFRDKYPDGRLRPADPSDPVKIITVENRTFLQYVACAYRDGADPNPGVGVAWEPFPGRTPYTKDSEAMVAETSAWGRAIVAALAADTRKGVASQDEIRNRRQPTPSTPAAPTRAQAWARVWDATKITEPDLSDEDRQTFIVGEARSRGLDGTKTADLTKLADLLEAAS